MSLKETKEHLIRLVGDPENSVIAISGKWGTGKTHLWNEIKTESKDSNVNKSLYVSLFGLSSIDQLKRKLIESAIPGADSHVGIISSLKQLFRVGVKAASEHYKALAALDGLNLLLLAPVLLRNAVIVIDDIERKHEKLGIDEVLGFIDEFSRQHGSRFILVLNNDQLANQDIWNKLREKVVDQEIRLLTTPEEAFSIAVELTPSSYADSIKRASISCGLTNIRIVGKVIRAVNLILGNRKLEGALLTRVVPSIVLFSAIYYKGIEDGPDFQFALNIGSPSDWAELVKDKNPEPTEEVKRRTKWRLLLDELGIHGCDEFEVLVVEFLDSGLFATSKLTPIIERYILEKDNVEARDKANQLLFNIFWDHRLTECQLIEMASELLPISGLLDPFLVSELQQALAELEGGADIGQAIVDSWIASFKTKMHEVVNDDNPFNRPLHQAIVAEFSAINAQAQARTNVLEACMHIIENNGWGTMDEIAMKRATVADFEVTIRNLDINYLRRFMRRMIEMRLQRQTYDQHFGTATECFVNACRIIANDTTSRRLSGLIKRQFKGTPLASELVYTQNQAETAAFVEGKSAENPQP